MKYFGDDLGGLLDTKGRSGHNPHAPDTPSAASSQPVRQNKERADTSVKKNNCLIIPLLIKN